MNNTNILYILLIGVLLALFVGVGIDTFYKMPQPPKFEQPVLPERPATMDSDADLKQQSVDNQIAFEKQNESYERALEKFSADRKIYERNVSIISIILAIVIAAASLIFLSKIPLIADGLILGSIFVLIYGVIRGFQGDDDVLRFAVVATSLVAVLCLGYFRFLKKPARK